MASIKKRGKGYFITVSNGYDVSGSKYEKQLHLHLILPNTKQQEKEVKAFAFEFEQLVKSGTSLEGRNITLQTFYYKWLNEYAEISLEQTTVRWYEQMFENRILPELGHLKLIAIKPLHIQTFCNNLSKTIVPKTGKPYSPSSVKRYHSALSSLFSKAMEWQLITTNPAKNVSLPKQKTASDSVKYFTPEQTITFFKRLNEEYSSDYTAHTRIVNGKEYTCFDIQGKQSDTYAVYLVV